jgi:hypothetical protein
LQVCEFSLNDQTRPGGATVARQIPAMEIPEG